MAVTLYHVDWCPDCEVVREKLADLGVAYEGIIDAFGHVSMRHPTKPDRYLISRSRSPEVVEASDIYEFTLDSEPVTPLPPALPSTT